MDLSYDYLLTVAESLLEQSGLPQNIIDKYFSLKYITFAEKEAKGMREKSLKEIYEDIIDWIQKSILTLKIDDQRVMRIRQQIKIRQDQYIGQEKQLISYFEEQVKSLEKSLKIIQERQDVEKKTIISKQLEEKNSVQVKFGKEIVTLREQITFWQKEAEIVKQQSQMLAETNSKLVIQINDIKRDQKQEVQKLVEQFQSSTCNYMEKQIQLTQEYKEVKIDEEQIHQLLQENQELKQQLIEMQEQVFLSEKLYHMIEQMEAKTETLETEKHLAIESILNQCKEKAEEFENKLKERVAECNEKEAESTELLRQIEEDFALKEEEHAYLMDYLKKELGESNEQREESIREQQQILQHIKQFCGRYDKLKCKYSNEINPTNQFNRVIEELAYHSDFLIFIANTFETDNMWLIQRLVEATKQAEDAEKAKMFLQKKNFYDDLDQTYLEVTNFRENKTVNVVK